MKIANGTASAAIRRNGGGSRLALITGGAGFVGSNLAHRLLAQGRPVMIFDNLSRPGVEKNLQWLRDTHGNALRVAIADIRDRDAVCAAVAQAQQVFHFAAQVAVTTSVVDPLQDFAINVQGTLNLLEAVRAQKVPPGVVFTSTNKVYGALQIELASQGQRYLPTTAAIREAGIGESQSLDFHSPYGCSKGAADQYVLDYARTYGIPAVVFRMSCIYGPHQFGTEDQGWVAHFLLRALDSQPITLYGDGKQVRDILYIDDLVDAFLLAEQHAAQLAGTAFNIGGGPRNAISLLDLLDRIESLHSERPDVRFEAWRIGDQRYYVSDTRRFERATGWRPRVAAADGIERLYRWLIDARDLDRAPRARSVAIAEAARVPS
ncbi:MAG TPA: NAD-dependent epimerase/dehydratase family protein, partial [Burkholderiaceae bacterium]|nr:NAD-dependent epimerase/dehydratase family protein [Burkholderiaceae bacterium]